MGTRLLALLGAVLFGCSISSSGAPHSEEQDNKILSLLLRRSYDDAGFTVVKPDTSLTHFVSIEQSKKYLKEKIRIEGYDIGPLVDLFFQRNDKPVRLTLKASPENGYIVDYEGAYKKYFGREGAGWDQWYKENPQAHGSTEVSLPAFDEKNHIVLVYIGTQAHWRAGSGHVMVFRYEEGKLEPLARMMGWGS